MEMYIDIALAVLVIVLGFALDRIRHLSRDVKTLNEAIKELQSENRKLKSQLGLIINQGRIRFIRYQHNLREDECLYDGDWIKTPLFEQVELLYKHFGFSIKDIPGTPSQTVIVESGVAKLDKKGKIK